MLRIEITSLLPLILDMNNVAHVRPTLHLYAYFLQKKAAVLGVDLCVVLIECPSTNNAATVLPPPNPLGSGLG